MTTGVRWIAAAMAALFVQIYLIADLPLTIDTMIIALSISLIWGLGFGVLFILSLRRASRKDTHQ